MAEAASDREDGRLYGEDRAAAVRPFDPSTFAETFTHRTDVVDGVRLHYVIGGEGEPLLMLHGWPASWYEFRKAMPLLAERFTVIAADLPGMGDSSAPAAYDKKTVASYFARLVERLGLGPVNLVGHDVGGPVSFSIAAFHPDAVKRLVLMEMMNAGEEQDQMQLVAFPNLWHIPFNAAPGVAESFCGGREYLYVSHCFNPFCYNPAAIGEEDLKEYVRIYSEPGKMHTSVSYYRTFPQDVADNEPFLKEKLDTPILYLVADGSMGAMGQTPYRSVEKYAKDSRREAVPSCGHWIAEERPVYVARRLTDFFSG